MSTTSLTIETLGGSAAANVEDVDWVVFSTRRRSMALPDQQGRTMAPATRRNTLPRADSRRVLRRLKGFLVEEQGRECKVAFVENNAPVFYYLPSSGLRNAGVTAENQPFEMDEFESKNPDGSFSTGYTFRPLAGSADAFSDSLNLDGTRQQKRNLILRRFGKTKN
jgi:hypothetical protein